MITSSPVKPTNTAEIVSVLIDIFHSYDEGGDKTYSAETPIETLGVDSFDFVEILFKIEDHYGVDLGYNANIKFSALTTIGDLADHILQITSGKMAA